MSNVSGLPDAEFDFWEFAACAKCQLPFSTSNGPPVPFWLTECGHVICNNHLNADQSCSKCGARGIQLVPLQQEMEAPMSDWFRSVPSALDVVAYAAKETMANQIRYFKARQHQLRNLLERCKRDIANLKKDNEFLVSENEQLRLHSGYDRHPHAHDNHTPTDAPNPNGKRMMMESQQCNQNSKRPKMVSSPHNDVVTPLGPNRLTLPPGQQVPELSSSRQDRDSDSQPVGQHATFVPQQRPDSSRLTERYAYVPPETPQFHSPQLSRIQAAPKVFQRTHPQQNQNERPQDRPQQPNGQQAMLPSTSSSRFKPAQTAQKSSRQATMGPPPTPQHVHQQVSSMKLQAMQFSNDSHDPALNLPPRMSLKPSGNRFVPPNSVPPSMGQRTVPSTSSGAPQRFFTAPGTANLGSTSDKAFTSGSNQQAFPRTASISGGRQRMPFNAGGGFG